MHPRRRLLSRRFARRAVAAFPLACALAACLSPTLPLPPPEEPDAITPSADGATWEIRGSCSVGAEVVVLNEATGRGAVYVDAARVGRYVVTIEGAACDVVTVSQTLGDEASGDTRFVLEAREGGTPVDPSACSP